MLWYKKKWSLCSGVIFLFTFGVVWCCPRRQVQAWSHSGNISSSSSNNNSSNSNSSSSISIWWVSPLLSSSSNSSCNRDSNSSCSNSKSNKVNSNNSLLCTQALVREAGPLPRSQLRLPALAGSNSSSSCSSSCKCNSNNSRAAARRLRWCPSRCGVDSTRVTRVVGTTCRPTSAGARRTCLLPTKIWRRYAIWRKKSWKWREINLKHFIIRLFLCLIFLRELAATSATSAISLFWHAFLLFMVLWRDIFWRELRFVPSQNFFKDFFS